MSTSAPDRILVVDDDDAKRYSISRVLRAQGFQVIEANCGAEAIRMADEKPDLIVLDVKLPDINGLEVCRHIKARAELANIPIVHISAAYVQLEDKVNALESGADAYLTDVVNPSEMIATVRALLRAKRAEDALRLNERRYRLLVQGVEDYAIFMIDLKGRISSWNEGVERILGYAEDEFLGQMTDIIFAPEDRANGVPKEEMRTAAEQGRAIDERWHLRKDGTRFFADGILNALFDDDGRMNGFFKIMRDRTERRRAEEERLELLHREQAARAEAEQANRLKDEFLATLSHELRTPLMAIMGWAELLQTGRIVGDDIGRGLATIDRNARAQAQLIDDLLDVSRIISGKLRLDAHSMDVAAVIRAAIESVQTAADAREIQVEQSLAADLPAIVGDASRIQQVVWNLLSNAIKFTPRGGRVTISAGAHQKSVEIVVTDSGQGIEPEFLPYVFERFRQSDATSKRSHAGLGLGLAIVRHLAELHGGSVSAHSAGKGHGATFTVRLPIAGSPRANPASSAEELRVQNDSTGFTEPLTMLAGAHILVVEDEADTRELIRRVLEQSQAEVRTASSVVDAIHQFEASRPDVLVTDIGMPHEDGFDLIRKIRSRPDSIPALALTAFARSEDRQRAMAAGFQMHLSKPISPAKLTAAIAELLGR